MFKLIYRLLAENFDINIGQHHNRVGYYATMRKSYDSCEHCSPPIVADNWDFAGHGHTLEVALLEAEAIAKGQQDQTKRKPDSFRGTAIIPQDTGAPMIIRQETEGVWIKTYEINGDETDLIEEDFEPSGETVWLDDQDNEIEPPANL